MTKSSGPTSSGEEDVRKGAWTAEEDDKLRAYIEKNGTGHWRSVGRKAGLQRCGKSCRLRWTNYLRPDIKHGSFTPEEEKLIIELHSSLGSRWSLIAAKLPGRTDNDIKNHWNTRLRKKLVDMGIDPVTHKPISELLINLAGNMANCKSGSVPKMLDDARRCFSDAAINKAVQDYVLGGVSMLQQSGSSNAAAAAAAAVQEMEAKMERAGADTQGPLHALPSQAADNLVTFAGMPDMPTFCPAIKTAFSSDSESFSDGSDVDTLSSGGVGSSLSSRRKYGGNGGQHLSLLARRGLGTHSIVIDSDEEIESPRRAVSALEPSVLNRKTRLSLSLQEAITQGVGLGKRTAENCSTSETTQAGSNKRHHRDLLQCQDFPSQQHQQQQQQQHQQHQHQQQQQQQQHFQQHHTFSFMGSSAMASSAMASGYGGFQAEAMAVAALAPLPPAEAGFGMGEEQGMGFSTSDFEASHLLRSSGQEGYGVPAASCSEWSEESLRQLLEPSSGFWNVEQQQQQGGRGAGGSQARASSGNGNMPFNDICSLLFTPRGGDGSAAVGAHSTSLQLDSPMGAARCGGNVVDDFFGISPMATPRSWAGSFPNVASETCNSRLQQQQQPSNSCGSSKPDIQACWQDVLLSTPKSMVPDMSHFDLPSPKVVTLWDFQV